LLLHTIVLQFLDTFPDLPASAPADHPILSTLKPTYLPPALSHYH
jgi:hypothetical protein